MPRVKIDYVVSFSSEDPDNQASNILAWDVSKKKWLCNKGELSCSIVLQLAKAVKIESINIGAYHAALIEVLVGLSEKPNEQFQVLVPNSVLLTPVESRRDDGIEKVRSFSGKQLSSDAKLKKWDRIRVVCAQPYNKHCKFGLSFIHIFEPEDTHKPKPALPSTSVVPPRLFQLDTFSSDEEEFRPGQLFAQSQKEKAIDTGAQIRQASSQALKNISDISTKLLKTPITKTGNKDQNRVNNECTNRKKESLLYNDEDDEPHAKIDRIVQKHKEIKEKEESQGKANKDDKANSSLVIEKQDGRKKASNKEINDVSNDLNASNKKRKRSDDNLTPGPIQTTLSNILSEVEFAISGYVNPQRSTLRNTAMALGAIYRPDWRPSCTHLICAFSNTPKLKTVRASKASTVAVTAEWIEMCHYHRRRLPWQWYATEPQRRVTPTPGWETRESGDTTNVEEGGGEVDIDLDTDDEIEKVLKKQKKKRLKSPSPESSNANTDKKTNNKSQDKNKKSEDTSDDGNISRDNNKKSENTSDDGNISRDSDIAFVKDERIKANITIFESDSDTEEDTKRIEDIDIDDIKELPNFFDGCTFLISELDNEYDRSSLERYIRAYGGLILKESDLLEDSTIDYEVCTNEGENHVPSCHVRPEWVWDCHRDRQRLPTTKYEL